MELNVVISIELDHTNAFVSCTPPYTSNVDLLDYGSQTVAVELKLYSHIIRTKQSGRVTCSGQLTSLDSPVRNKYLLSSYVHSSMYDYVLVLVQLEGAIKTSSSSSSSYVHEFPSCALYGEVPNLPLLYASRPHERPRLYPQATLHPTTNVNKTQKSLL